MVRSYFSREGWPYFSFGILTFWIFQVNSMLPNSSGQWSDDLLGTDLNWSKHRGLGG